MDGRRSRRIKRAFSIFFSAPCRRRLTSNVTVFVTVSAIVFNQLMAQGTSGERLRLNHFVGAECVSPVLCCLHLSDSRMIFDRPTFV